MIVTDKCFVIRLLTASIYAREEKRKRKHAGACVCVGGGGGEEGVGFTSEGNKKIFILVPTTPRVTSLCAGVQFSRDSMCALNDRIKLRENRGL